MTPERIDELWSRYFSDASLSPEDQRELQAALEADPGLRARFLEDRQIHGLLRGRPLEAERDAFTAAFRDRLGLEGQSDEFLKTVRDRMKREQARPATTRRAHRPVRTSPNYWPALIAAAAGLFLAILYFSSVSDPAPAPRTEDAVRSTPVEPRPEPKTPEKTPIPDVPKPPPPEKAVVVDRPVAPEPPKEPPKPELPVVKETPKPVVQDPTPPAPVPDKPAKPAETQVALAAVESVEGEAYAVRGEEKRLLAQGAGIVAGESIETVGTKSLAALTFPDGTEIRMEGESRVAGLADRAGKGGIGKWIELTRGTLSAVVKKQPQGQAMLIDTPHGSAKVMGTTLRMTVDSDRAILDVIEGKVQLKNLAGSTTLVEAGHQAVAAVGVKLKAAPTLSGGIMLRPEDGKPSNREWLVVKDPEASLGVALDSAVPWDHIEATSRFLKGTLGYVEFTFTAEAGVDYHLWVRAASVGPRDLFHDGVLFEVKNGRFNYSIAPTFKPRTDVSLMTGFYIRKGYWWAGPNDDSDVNQAPVILRFNTAGPQILRMYAIEPPIRVDTIWLTPTQKARPAVDAVPAVPVRTGR